MDVKKPALIDLLVFLYVFSLGFIRLGIPFFHYHISLAELFLVLILVSYAVKGFNSFTVGKPARRFILLFLVFLTGVMISFFGMKDTKAGLIELSAYLYGLASMILFSLYIHEKGRHAIRVISYGCFSILLLVILGSFLVFTGLPFRDAVLFNKWNYIFFASMPNQLSVFIIICFNVYLITRESYYKIKYAGFFIPVFLPLLFFVPVVLTGSRTGMAVSAMLVLYSYSLFFREMKKARNVLFPFLGAAVLLFLMFIFFKGSPQAGALLKRGLSVYQNFRAGSLIKGDVREENFNDGIKAFLSRPVTGVGLGNVWKNHSKWEIHNNYLSVLAETGLCGLIPFLFLLGYIILLIFRSKKKERYLVVYLSVLAYSLQHHILRERWFWFFLLFLVQHIDQEGRDEKADSLPDGENHGA